MSDNAPAAGENNGQAAAVPTPPPAKNNNNAGTANDLPQWARDELASVRSEAAENRVKARSAQEQADKFAEQLAALTDEKATAVADLNAASLNLAKYQVAIDKQIPGDSLGDFVKALSGTNEDEIKAHAEVLSKHWSIPGTAPATDKSQARGGTATPESAFGDFVMNALNK